MNNLTGRMATKGIQNPIPTKIADTGSNLAVKLTTSGSITYIGVAAPGSAQASPVWQCRKIDETTGMVITWADSNTLFDNVATDLTALTYG